MTAVPICLIAAPCGGATLGCDEPSCLAASAAPICRATSDEGNGVRHHIRFMTRRGRCSSATLTT